MDLENEIYFSTDAEACKKSIIRDIQLDSPGVWTDEQISKEIDRLLENGSLIGIDGFLVRNFTRFLRDEGKDK